MFPRFNAHVGRSVGTAFAIFATTAAVIASVGPDTAPASSPSSGTLQAYKGGFRKPLDNTALGYSYALAGATFEESTSTGFGSSTPFGPTDSSGLASLSTSTGTHYVREKTAPSGWRALSSLTWGGSTQSYVGRASVTSGGTATASVDSGASTRFINALDNPPLPTSCGHGLRVLLLLDTSGSTSGHNNAYKTAANTFINTLSDTPTNLKISSFATNSSPDNTTQYDLNTVTGQNDAKTRVSNIYPHNTSGSGYTNWDAALNDAAAAVSRAAT